MISTLDEPIPTSNGEEVTVGFHRGITFDDYVLWPAVNATTLNSFSRTPAHAFYELSTGGKPGTASLDLGWLVHVAVLEPERFKKDFVVAPQVNRKTKVGKATWAQFEAEHPGAQAIDEGTHAKVLAMAHSLGEHETAHQFFSGRGHNEVSILWADKEHGVRCKARLDRVGMLNEWPVLGELKTARDASRREFERSIYKYGYHISAAHYLAGLEALAPVPAGNPFRRFIFFVVESEPPYCSVAYELDDAALDEGVNKRSRYIRKWRECVESGNWPGYSPGVEYASLPAWAFKEWVDE